MNMTMTKEKESIVKQLDELIAEYQGKYDEGVKESTALTEAMFKEKDNMKFDKLFYKLKDCNADQSYLMGKIHAINEALDIIKIG